MRQLIRQREIVADEWRYPGESGQGPQVLDLAEFLAGGPTPPAPPFGVRLQPADAVETLAPRLTGVSLVVVQFPKSGDGRGYSQARLLRQRYGFAGELRASGDVKRDQLFLLERCGFDSFDLAAGEDLRAAAAHFADYSVAYQALGGPADRLAMRASVRTGGGA